MCMSYEVLCHQTRPDTEDPRESLAHVSLPQASGRRNGVVAKMWMSVVLTSGRCEWFPPATLAGGKGRWKRPRRQPHRTCQRFGTGRPQKRSIQRSSRCLGADAHHVAAHRPARLATRTPASPRRARLALALPRLLPPPPRSRLAAVIAFSRLFHQLDCDCGPGVQRLSGKPRRRAVTAGGSGNVLIDTAVACKGRDREQGMPVQRSAPTIFTAQLVLADVLRHALHDLRLHLHHLV